MYTARAATVDDAAVIARFNQAMAQETEGKALDLTTLSAGVRRVFDEPSHGRYLVAESEAGDVAGCLLITFEWSDWRNGQFWWIQSVYVHPEHRRRGVFQLLYRTVRQLGDQAGSVCGYRLYVERDNTRAQQTYRDLGMTQTPYLMFEDRGS
ncbi:MAG: GNAT family N-acetyltransferase [Planctomycetota bacterium]